MSDMLVEDCIVYLNIVSVKLLYRLKSLEHVEDKKEWIRDDQDRLTRARDHVKAALTFIHQSHFAPEEVQLELPW